MKAAQIVSLSFGVLALLASWFLITGLGGDSSASSGGAAGILWFVVVFPFFCISALLAIPSTLALMLRTNRVKNDMASVKWVPLIVVNALFSLLYISIIVQIVVVVITNT